MPRQWEYLAILSLLAASFMLFQISVLRELRYQLSTIFTLTPFLFSSVVLFIGVGAIAARRMKSETERILRYSVALLPVVLIPLFAVTILIAQGMMSRTISSLFYGARQPVGDAYMNSVVVAFIVVAVLGYGVVFLLQGLIFALYFHQGRETGTLSQVYAVDLLASGSAAVLGGYLSFIFTPVHMTLVAAGMLLLALWITFRYLNIRLSLVIGVTALVAAMIGGELLGGFIANLESPRWLGPGLVYSAWTPYRRIDVVEDTEKLLVFADRQVFHNYDKTDVGHLNDNRAIPVRSLILKHPEIKDVMVIGAGTGSDVRIIRGLVPWEVNVVAVELDAGFVETARAFPWLWNSYRTADIVVQEGRYFLENTKQDFDLVLYAYIDPQSAISQVGLPDANFLYTDTGIQRAFQRVRDGGYLVITRVFFVEQERAFIQRLCATLRSAGISPEQTRIYRHKWAGTRGYYGHLTTLQVVIRKGGQGVTLDDERLLAREWIAGGRPTTDEFPFSLLTGSWFSRLALYVRGNISFLVVLGGLLLALVVRLSFSVGSWSFFLLGLGSFLVECLVLFYSFLLIGNPSLSAGLAVGGFLFWNGIGSLLSDRLERWRWFGLLVPVVVLLYALTAPALNTLTLSSSQAVRTVVFAGHLAVPGIALGAMFPIVLRRFREERVSSMYFLDLVGCSVAPILFWLAMSYYGVSLVGMGATLAYGVLALVLLVRQS